MSIKSMLKTFWSYDDVTKYSIFLFFAALIIAAWVLATQHSSSVIATLPNKCYDYNITVPTVVGCAYGCKPIWRNDDENTGDIIGCTGKPYYSFQHSCEYYEYYTLFIHQCGTDFNVTSIDLQGNDYNRMLKQCISMLREHFRRQNNGK